MRKILVAVTAVIAATGLAASADASINYNASKSNTVTLHCRVSHGHRTCARTHTRAPSNRGASAGKRMH